MFIQVTPTDQVVAGEPGTDIARGTFNVIKELNEQRTHRPALRPSDQPSIGSQVATSRGGKLFNFAHI
jgi:hypothetical protein